MAFKDYYSILRLDVNASEDEIKVAFKTQALRWHPDKNKGINTTAKMQEINEAYLILKDKEARERYDIQYRLFKQKVSSTHNPENSYVPNNDVNFESTDEVLKKWMDNAQKQSVSLAQQLIIELRATGKRALVGAGESFVSAIKWQLVLGGGFFLFLLIAKSCH